MYQIQQNCLSEFILSIRRFLSIITNHNRYTYILKSIHLSFTSFYSITAHSCQIFLSVLNEYSEPDFSYSVLLFILIPFFKTIYITYGFRLWLAYSDLRCFKPDFNHKVDHYVIDKILHSNHAWLLVSEPFFGMQTLLHDQSFHLSLEAIFKEPNGALYDQ